MMRLRLLAISTILATIAVGAQAKGTKWMDASGVGLPAGAKLAVVSGDPTKAGKFTVKIKMPASYTVPPHSHPGDETVRVLNGATLTYGMGNKLDTSNSGSLTKGYHVTMKAGMNHWVTTSTPTDIQVAGDGPFAITYANAADDPRTKK